MLIVAAIAVLILVAHLKIAFNHKVAEAFGLGIDFGKAIASLTEDQKSRIVADAFPNGIPGQREGAS